MRRGTDQDLASAMGSLTVPTIKLTTVYVHKVADVKDEACFALARCKKLTTLGCAYTHITDVS